MKFNEIVNKRTLANFLGIEYKELTYILYALRTDNLYQTFEIPKKNGDMRCINAPQEPLKHVQRNLAKRLMAVQEKYYLKGNSIVQGFTIKRGIITNGNQHRNKRYVLNIDLENFFDSFHFGRVKGYFQKNSYFKLPEEVAACIANLACYQGKLPQGAPSSPVITNLICSILDRRLAAIAKKYHSTYTRYADDLTFSSNSKDFIEKKDDFLSELYAVIEKSGFTVNQTKTRLSFHDSRQEVTGLVVNKKIGVKREFYKNTRSMLNYLYKGKPISYNGTEITLQQLEGRLAFINQIDWYNNRRSKIKKSVYKGSMNSRERQYQQFLFYKYFFASPKPLIVTEGKTDIVYIRSALQSLYALYPKLIKKKPDGTFEYLVSFFHRTERLDFFLGIDPNGASTMKNIYNLYTGANNFPNLLQPLTRYGTKPSTPVILLFDNEQQSKRPLREFLGHIKKGTCLKDALHLHITENLYLATCPLVKEKAECEIEDLFDNEVLDHEIDGKKFDRKGKDSKTHYSKQVFATYISQSISSINFSRFRPMLDTFSAIITEYKPPIPDYLSTLTAEYQPPFS